jgi:hypothetical protein
LYLLDSNGQKKPKTRFYTEGGVFIAKSRFVMGKAALRFEG